jgi:hypothetical protein
VSRRAEQSLHSCLCTVLQCGLCGWPPPAARQLSFRALKDELDGMDLSGTLRLARFGPFIAMQAPIASSWVPLPNFLAIVQLQMPLSTCPLPTCNCSLEISTSIPSIRAFFFSFFGGAFCVLLNPFLSPLLSSPPLTAVYCVEKHASSLFLSKLFISSTLFGVCEQSAEPPQGQASQVKT